MSLIQTPWTSQPQQLVLIDWSNPITRGLKSFYILTPDLWRINLVTGQVGGSVIGSGVSFSGNKLITSGVAGDGALLKHGLPTTISSPISIVCGWKRTSGAVSWSILSTSISNWTGIYGDATGLVSTTNNNSFDGVIATGGNGNTVFSLSSNNLTGKSQLGALVTDTALTMPSSSAVSDRVTLGFSRRGINDGGAVAQFTHFGAFDRALSPAEIQSLADNPWQIFKPLPRRIFVPVSAGGGTAAVTADHNASYTIIGSVTADASSAYAIRAAVTADATASYSLRAAAQADQAAAYAIRAAVASDLAGSYAIQTAGTVTTGLDAAYAVRGSVAGDISVGYQIAAAVQAEVAAAYAVRAAVQKDLAAGYSVSDSVINVASDIVCTYAINNGVSPSYPSAESIAAAILAAAQITPIHADMRKIKGQVVGGSGTEVDPWGPT